MFLESRRRRRAGSRRHGAGDDLGPHRPAAAVRAEGAAAGRGRRAARSGRARSRRCGEDSDPVAARARGARRPRLPRARAALDDPRRGGVPLQARPDPGRRLRRACRRPRGRCSTARWREWLSARRTARRAASRSAPTTSTRPAQLEAELYGAMPAGARRGGGRRARAGGPAGARARGERDGAAAARPRRRARADAGAPLPGGPRGVAHDRHPDDLGRDDRGERGRRRGRRLPHRGAGADRAGSRRALSRRRQRSAHGSSHGVRSRWPSPTTTWPAFDASEVLGNVAWWEGDLDEVERLAGERLAIAERIGRRDLQISVLLELSDVHAQRLETAQARGPLARAEELAAESASPTTRGWTLRAVGRQALIEGRLDGGRGGARAGTGALRRERRGARRSGGRSTSSGS